jgi:hypothetical protein
VLTAVFLFLLPGSQLARARGTISQFFAGWAAYIFAAAFAALLTTLFFANPSLLGAFQAAATAPLRSLRRLGRRPRHSRRAPRYALTPTRGRAEFPPRSGRAVFDGLASLGGSRLNNR